jgi:glycosyltransferase involved in cell wall biosynthesis
MGIPVVVSERSDPTQQTLGAAWEFLRDRTYRQATAIVALTQNTADFLGNRYRTTVRVIPSAVDVPPFSSDRILATDQRRILGIGRLEPEKGFDRLIEAFSTVARQSPPWSLRILGEGSMRASLEGQIGDLGLTGRVTMPGWIQPVWDELARSTIFALPSRYEGFPSALLEAMATGVPSVAVDCASGGPREILNDPSLGLLVPNQVSALAGGLCTLVQDAERRERIGQAGKKVIERFGWDAMVDAYEEILHQAAGGKQPTG